MPISDCEVRDPRIRRTRQLLQGALQTLMQARSFDEISVQDITDTATVNRATFYDHYTDKFALLDAMVGGGFHKLLHERNVSFDGTCPSAASSIILATCDYLSLSHGDSSPCTQQNVFEPLMESAMTAAIRRVLIKGLTKDSESIDSAEMLATTASWAIYGAVKQWFYTPDHVPAEEIVARILRLVMPILEAGRTLESPNTTVGAHS
jgi:AcrR family transcriptional regulator